MNATGMLIAIASIAPKTVTCFRTFVMFIKTSTDTEIKAICRKNVKQFFHDVQNRHPLGVLSLKKNSSQKYLRSVSTGKDSSRFRAMKVSSR